MNHTDEEIRAAIDLVRIGQWNPAIKEQIMAALHQPVIHSDVPILCDAHCKDELWAAKFTPPGATNIRPLIPVETVKDLLKTWYDDRATGYVSNGVIAWMEDKLAHYQTHGPEDTQ